MLVKQLAMDGDLVLALIARDEESDAVAGLVALSKMHVAIGGDPAPAVALAPLAVMPDYRRSGVAAALVTAAIERSEEHTSELQSLMRISYAVFCLKKKKNSRIVPDLKQAKTR